MVAPNMFTRELELKIQKLATATQDNMAKELLRIQNDMNSVYDQINKALSQVGYQSHQEALKQVDSMRDKLNELAAQKDLESITNEVQKAINNNSLQNQVTKMREAIEKARTDFEREIGSEGQKSARSFEQFARNLVFTFAKPQFFEPAGAEFHDVESLSRRRGIGAPIGGKYVGDPRVSFNQFGGAEYGVC
jgi:hypothetical protein